MEAGDLKPEQVRAVLDGTAPTLDYLAKLVARMDALAWKPNDPAYVAVVRARDGLRELQAALREPHPPELPRWARGDSDGA